jgi:phosphatidylglycerophosphate synthase
MTSALVVVSSPIAHERFCGRTLIERHELLLRRAGAVTIRVIAAADLERHLSRGDSSSLTAVVIAERLFDARLYAAAVSHGGPVRMTDGDEPVGLEVVSGAAGQAPQLVDLRSLSSYSRELRRHLRPYWMRVATAADRPALTRVLVEASGKGHQDLPATVLNAPIEKAAMRWLANTRVTPNQITAVCNVLAFAVAALLATGHLLAGAVGALVVGIVDGLDGRQARVQLRTTPLGRLEHLLDKVYEIAWMAALAYALSGGFAARSYLAWLAVWTAAYLLDTAAYDLVKWRTGATLDEASRLDAWIRLAAGRRNVYTCMLLVGVLAGQADAAFRAIVWWSLATAIVHGIRALVAIRRGRRDMLVWLHR